MEFTSESRSRRRGHRLADHVVVGGDVVPSSMARETLTSLLDLKIPVQFIVGNGEVAVLEQMAGREPAKKPTVQEWVKAYGQWLYDRSGGWTFEQPIPGILYKYDRPERVHVLRECSVRFSQRAAFDEERELRREEMRAYISAYPKLTNFRWAS